MTITILRNIIAYRGFILSSVKREFQSRYRNSLLGAIWNILNPLAMIIVYTVIFSGVMKARIPGIDNSFGYSIYLCSGLLTWGLFSEIVLRSQNTFIDNANLLKKITFPRLCLPIVAILSALVNFLISFSIFLIFLILSGNMPGIEILSYIPILLVLSLLAIGIGITVGVINVFFRDAGQLFSIVVQFWFWFTPIVYTSDILPEKIKNILSYNPMTGIIEACHTVMVKKVWPDWWGLLPALCVGGVFVWFGLSLFRKHSGEIVDEL
ncbi:ABC transporter permease [Dickeya oryzae]|uniref:Transport permease protein n=1 Tax=Dickeya oryzae TaxID=1240404 RepID=A0AB39INY0_9GAMM|nr:MULTISPECIES: ABC transporter permease [Dickeya]MBP2857901.1 ABC transporter permease [Dickeya oryzae]MCA6992197.1 ABC transporter permease [Dickeya oryzae]